MADKPIIGKNNLPLLLLTLFLWWSSFYSLAQSQRDSLKNLLQKTSSGKVKADTYNDLASQYLKVSLDTALLFAEAASSESKKWSYQYGIAKSYLVKSMIYDLQGRFEDAVAECERAITIFHNIKNEAGLAEAYNNLGTFHLWQSQFEQAAEFLNKSLAIYQKLNDKKGLGSIYKSLGNLSMNQGKYSEALQAYLTGSAISEEIGDVRLSSSFYTNTGTAYQQLGNYEMALTYYLKSLAIKEQLNDKYGQAALSNNIGLMYAGQGKYDEALKHHRKSLQIDLDIGSEIDVSMDYNNIGNVHLSSGAYDSALHYFTASLQMREKLNRSRDIAHSLVNIGRTYLEKKDYQKAVEYYLRSLEINEAVGDSKRTSLNYINLGQAYTKLGRFREAEDFLTRGLAIREETGDYFGTGIALEALASLYDASGDFRRSLTFYKRYIAVRDSFENVNRNKQVAELQMKYETEKKEQELAMQSQRLAILQQKKEIEAIWKNGLIAGIIILAAIAGLVYRSQRIRNQRKQQLLDAQQALTNQLQEVDRMKSHFFANISHEFRTPLTLILGPLEDLQNEVKEANSQRKLQSIEQSARRLLKLINQLLSLSRIEAGKLELKAAPQNIIPFLRGLSNAFHSLAEKKKIVFKFDAAEEEILVFFDAEKVEQIVNNLLSNAFKFTGNNGRISLSVGRNEWQGTPALQITVADTGRGISAEQLPYVFDRFFQADASDDKAYEGAGIGLALAKELALLHKGDIEVESEKGKGSAFKLYLPLGKERLQEHEIVMAPPASSPRETSFLADETPVASDSPQTGSADKPLILIVEDHPDLRQYIQNALNTDYRIRHASDGEEGLAKALNLTPDLIVSDVMMPKMNGIQMCRRLKSDIRTNHIPIILLTAKTTEEDKLKGLENQADDYLTKPFNTRELAARIKNLIDVREKLRARFKSSVIIKPQEINATSAEQAFLEKLMQLLEKHIADERFGVEQLSAELNISRVHLHRKLQALTNRSPSQFIRSFRLQRAMDLLQKKAGNIAEVAYSVGFSSPTYFSKCFSEEFGYPPKEVKSLSTRDSG